MTPSLAQSPGANTLVAQTGAAAYPGEVFIPTFRYIAPAGAVGAVVAGENEPKRKPEQQRIVDLHQAGEYGAAGTEGLALIAQESADDGLQLIIANSLAWSGRLREATKTYQAVTDPSLVDDANVGIANILRWQGSDHLAAPIYRDILAKRPDLKDAREGLELAERELSPRTTVTFGTLSDSTDFRRNGATLNHRWRDSSGYNIMEVETSGVRDSLPGVEAQQQDVTLRYQALGLELKPAFEISMPTGSDKKLYAGVKVLLDEDRVQLDAGVVNWGRLANNPNALAQNLTASHFGVNAKRQYGFGDITGRLDYYNISDTNTISAVDVRLTPNWRPLGNHVKPFVGVETRQANFRSANYWSPDEGSGSAYAGLMGEWGQDDWSCYASGQVGLPIYGDAGDSWSVSGGAKRWVRNDMSLGFNLWAMASTRAGAEYRAQSANIVLEKLWR